ncbi:hypothetical protein [Chiayiivirga flava]|uniref:Uncharacterized protein n=1 Tax=Chiayiivirga flava TaxID=659595 RepID=A0A7W8D3M1_9GAMM|nr:hypothetical protein [Chiayiivirga flava]MBB5206862.1 hypothetical protein [Chiayiivirga flava]
MNNSVDKTTLEKHKKFNGLTAMIAIAGFSMAGSLALILVVHELDAPALDQAGNIVQSARSIWSVILEHIATALAILSIWHVVDQIVVRRELKQELFDFSKELKTNAETLADDKAKDINSRLDTLEQAVTLARHDAALGLSETFHDVDIFSFREVIKSTHSLTAVLADGHSWVAKYSEELSERFSDHSKKTTFILAHPDSDLIPVLSRKIGMTPELCRQRIYLTVRALTKLKESNSAVKIRGHSLINCHSVYIADKRAIFSPYFLSTTRRQPPIFVFKDTGGNSFANKLAKDVDVLERESSPIMEQLALSLEKKPGSEYI